MASLGRIEHTVAADRYGDSFSGGGGPSGGDS
jgi:hypothetical protein